MEFFILGLIVGLVGYFFAYIPISGYLNESKVYPNRINQKVFEENFSKLSTEDLENIEGLKTLMVIVSLVKDSTIQKYYKEDLLKAINLTYRCTSSKLRDRFGEEYIAYLLQERNQ